MVIQYIILTVNMRYMYNHHLNEYIILLCYHSLTQDFHKIKVLREMIQMACTLIYFNLS